MELHGKKRYAVGRLNGVSAPPGTIVGPNDTKEFMVVLEQDSDGVTVGYAQEGDLDQAMLQPYPRSVTECRLRLAMAKLRVR